MADLVFIALAAVMPLLLQYIVSLGRKKRKLHRITSEENTIEGKDRFELLNKLLMPVWKMRYTWKDLTGLDSPAPHYTT